MQSIINTIPSMSHSITISYPSSGTDSITLDYFIELTGVHQLITCNVVNKNLPYWLQVRKFIIPSLKKKNGYVPIFSEANNNTNRDTSLFIDEAYKNIMEEQDLKIYSE